ncbi:MULTISPECIES: hypothetical protein [Bradyrhizobium]|jgi:hypothetical protein|uniref:hypothetical protein n=1 Tax=Bradyrhizobium TaxID=374 RepID=UPI000B0AC494|nr:MULTISPECIES: hypothetical protein [Bradyrhizobium]
MSSQLLTRNIDAMQPDAFDRLPTCPNPNIENNPMQSSTPAGIVVSGAALGGVAYGGWSGCFHHLPARWADTPASIRFICEAASQMLRRRRV